MVVVAVVDRGEWLGRPYYVVVYREGERAVAVNQDGVKVGEGFDHAKVIQAAVNYGGVVYVKEGEYVLDPQGRFTAPGFGTYTYSVVVQNDVKIVASRGAVFKPRGVNIGFLVGEAWFEWEGGTFDGSLQRVQYLDGSGFILTSGRCNVVVRDVVLKNQRLDGIYIGNNDFITYATGRRVTTSHSEYAYVENVKAYDVAGEGAGVVVLDAVEAAVVRGVFLHKARRGVHVSAPLGGAAGAYLIDGVVSHENYGPVVTNYNGGAVVRNVVARDVRGSVVKILGGSRFYIDGVEISGSVDAPGRVDLVHLEGALFVLKNFNISASARGTLVGVFMVNAHPDSLIEGGYVSLDSPEAYGVVVGYTRDGVFGTVADVRGRAYAVVASITQDGRVHDAVAYAFRCRGRHFAYGGKLVVDEPAPDKSFAVGHGGAVYFYRNSGMAVLPSGRTSITVSHGLAARPSKVLITPMGEPPGKLWVQNVTDTSFDIATSTAPTTDLAIAWHAEI